MKTPPMSPELFVRWNKGGWPVVSFGPEVFAARQEWDGATKPPLAPAQKLLL